MDALSTAVEFRARRVKTWRIIRWWLLAALVGIVALVTLVSRSMGAYETKVGSILMLFICGCLVATYLTIKRLYRCPNCNVVPRVLLPGWKNDFGDDARDIPWNPATCPNCETPLR